MSEIYKGVFDYAKTTEEQKEAIEEVIRILENRDGENVPMIFIINELKQNFNLEDVPVRPVEQSSWYNLTKDFNINGNVQGYKIVTKPDGTREKIPHISLNVELETLDAMITQVVSNIVNTVKSE